MDDRRSRLRWRCRRGMRELDELFGRFLARDFAGLDEDALDALERMLDEPDVEVLAWVMGQREPPRGEYAPLCALLRSAADEPRA